MRRSSRRTVAFAAAGLVLAVLVVELLLRGVFAVAPLELHFFKYRTAPWIRDDHPGWGPWHHADAETVHVMRCAEARYTSNSFGMRDRPRQLARTAGTPRVAVLGDSFTEGFLVGDDETFCALLEDRHFSGGVEFLNFGTSGNLGTTQQWLQYTRMAMCAALLSTSMDSTTIEGSRKRHPPLLRRRSKATCKKVDGEAANIAELNTRPQ